MPMRLTLRWSEIGTALAIMEAGLPEFSAQAGRAFLSPRPPAKASGSEVHPFDVDVVSGELVTEASFDVVFGDNADSE